MSLLIFIYYYPYFFVMQYFSLYVWTVVGILRVSSAKVLRSEVKWEKLS